MKKGALIFGFVLMLLGILGFFPATAPDGFLFGIFRVDEFHNLVHLLVGAVGVTTGMTSKLSSRIFFMAAGSFFAILALFGLFYGNMPLFGLIVHNFADFWLHAVFAGYALYMAYAYGGEAHLGGAPSARL